MTSRGNRPKGGLGKKRPHLCRLGFFPFVLLLVSTLFLVASAQTATAAAPTLNVRDCGARGDGTSDDTAAIQRAIDHAGSTPLYLPTGTYIVTRTIALRSNLTLVGDGANSVVKLVGGDDWTRVLIGEDLTNLTLRSFTVDANAASGRITGSGEQRHCVFLDRCSDSLIDDMVVTQPLGDGIFLYGQSERITVQDCVAIAGWTSNARVGINFQMANHSIIQRNRVEQFDVGYKAEIDPGAPDSVGNRILNNTYSGPGLSLGLNGSDTGKCRDYVVEGNDFHSGPGDQCVWISGTYGCLFRGNALSGADMGVYMPFDAHAITIEANTFADQKSGVVISNYGNLGPCDGIKVVSNTFATQTVVSAWETCSNVDVAFNQYSGSATLIKNAERISGLSVHDNTLFQAPAPTTSTFSTTWTPNTARTLALAKTTSSPTTALPPSAPPTVARSGHPWYGIGDSSLF